MVTPYAAEHRDLEARFRNVEDAIRDIRVAVSKRPAMTVRTLAATDTTAKPNVFLDPETGMVFVSTTAVPTQADYDTLTDAVAALQTQVADHETRLAALEGP